MRALVMRALNNFFKHEVFLSYFSLIFVCFLFLLVGEFFLCTACGFSFLNSHLLFALKVQLSMTISFLIRVFTFFKVICQSFVYFFFWSRCKISSLFI